VLQLVSEPGADRSPRAGSPRGWMRPDYSLNLNLSTQPFLSPASRAWDL